MVVGASRRLAGAGLALGVVVFGTLTGSTATADPSTPDEPSSIVEDYSYPDAAAVLAQYNVVVISGDGHILVADCGTPPDGDIGVIKAFSTEPVGVDGEVCFKVLASSGHLVLELPGVFEIRGDGQRSGTGHHLTAILRTDAGELPPVTVNPSGSTQVGVGINPDNPPTTLLQLTVTP